MAVALVIHGAGGRMGREVIRAALGDPDFSIVACVEQKGSPSVGMDIGIACGQQEAGMEIVEAVPDQVPPGTAIIDFSTPTATVTLMERLPRGVASLVIGTTGFTESQRRCIAQTARSIAVLTSPNMSIGVNLMYHLVELVARRLGRRYDVEIVEAHHRHKKDAPSGTARRLGEIVADARGVDYAKALVHGRTGVTGERTESEIGMHAIRAGDIVGDHLVIFAGDGERLEVRHVAHSRQIFARGSLAAAKWLDGREPGLYSMTDVLGK